MPALIALALLAPPARAAVPDPAAVLAELNQLRETPAAHAAELRRIAGGYVGRYWVEADGTPHASIEGVAAVREAAAALDRAAPVPPLASDAILAAAARDHVDAQGHDGGIGHVGPGGTMPGDRVRRRGGDIYVNEVIAYGMHNAADVVRQLIIDDGVAGRGHRRLILSAAFRHAGIWCGPHATQGTMCVVDLAGEAGGRAYVPRE